MLKEKREIKRERKREKILEAAAELFSTKHYHEVMMDDVAKLISVAKGTVYNYFTSKEELYFTIMHTRMENLLSLLKQKIESEKNSIDSLRAFVVHLYMFMMKHQKFFLIYQRETLNGNNSFCEDMIALEKQMKQMIMQIISRGEKEGVFRKVDEEFAISLIFGSIYGAVQRGINSNLSNELIVKEKEEIFDFVLHGLYSGFNNIKELPLKGKTIVITRTIEQSQESAAALTNLGANVIIVPTLEIVPPSDWSKFDSVVSHPERIDFIIFTSVHAVQMFSERCQEIGAIINYNRIKVVAVGNKTSSYCHKNNISVNIVPEKFSAEGVIEVLSKYNLKNKVVFIPRSAIGREELPMGLKDLGAIIKSVPVYNVAIPSGDNVKTSLQQLDSSNVDLFIFTSPSTFENFLQIANIKNPFQYFGRFDIAAIGPTTKEAIESKKVKVNILPDEFTINGLTKKIVEYYSNNKEKA
ncbi:MAG TPA: uroporphyrinogen-III synthase [Ignavibacteriaceae bacterium]|nr:uroporphyrinogen-III synthase [Ignavibacteriaceae bacterium]